MDIGQSETEKLELVSRRGFLSAASVSAGASLLASNAAAQVNAVALQSADQLISQETLQATQDALTAQAKLAGQMFGPLIGDIHQAIVRSQGDAFKLAQTGLAQLQQDGLILQAEADRLGRICKILVAAAHAHPKKPLDLKVKSNVQSLAQQVIEAANASPTAVAIGSVIQQATTSEVLAIEASDCTIAAGIGAIIGGAVGAAVGAVFGVPGAGGSAGAFLDGLIAGSACEALSEPK